MKAAALLADGCTNERVAAELGMPLDWVQSLEQSLPVTADTSNGGNIFGPWWSKLDVVETRKGPLALAILKSLKVEAPAVHRQTAPEMLRAQCTQDAEVELRDRERKHGLGYGFHGDKNQKRASYLRHGPTSKRPC